MSILTAALPAFLTVNSASAQAPVAATEHIDVTIAQNQPIEITFENIFDRDHPKVLELHGFLDGPVPGTLAVFFDWYDEAGSHFFSPVQEFKFFPGGLNPIDLVFTIPFCPPQVSVDFRLGDAPSAHFVGDFTHICIPEPSSFILGGLALVGLAWRKRKS